MTKNQNRKGSCDIHRQQLFHWIGSELDKENRHRKTLNDAVLAKCLQYLRGSLERGLWVRSPRVPEAFQYKGQRFTLKEPIACFTEWSLGQSLLHTAEYGRIGFGFPKRWVIERGGQSVTYFRHSEKGSFLHSIFRLLRAMATERKDGEWIARNGAFVDLRYLLHFAKMIREAKAAPEPGKLLAPAAAPQRLVKLRKKKPTQAATDTQTFGRKFGRPLGFVQEREWRIVYHRDNRRFIKGPGCPDYYLPYVPGDELFTLVLPDNKVVSRVLQSDWFVERLFVPWKHYQQLSGRRVPPVTLLAHTDIGTF